MLENNKYVAVCTLGSKGCIFFLFLNWSIIDVQCCANICCTVKWLSYTHINPIFKCYFPLWLIPGDWIQFFLLYSRTLLLIHMKCNVWDIPKFVFYHQFKTNNSHDSHENLGFPGAPLVITPFLREKVFLNILPGGKQRLPVIDCLCRKYLNES